MKYRLKENEKMDKKTTAQKINTKVIQLLLSYEFIPVLILLPLFYAFQGISAPIDDGILLGGTAFVGLLFVLWYRKKYLKDDILFEQKKKMNKKVLMYCILFTIACQGIFSMISVGGEQLFNIFGLTMEEAITQGSVQMEETIPMLIYGGCIAPIFEEILCRGTIMRHLQKNGKVYAIVMTAALFGLLHGNLPQGIFAFAFGIILGYIAMEYSLSWAIFLHFFNNCIFGMGMGLLSEYFGSAIDVLYTIILVLAMILSARVLFKHKAKINKYLQKNPTRERKYRNGWLIAFIIIHLLFALTTITALPMVETL